MNTLPTPAQIDSIHSTLALAIAHIESKPISYRITFSVEVFSVHEVIHILETWIEACDDELPVDQCMNAIRIYHSLSL